MPPASTHITVSVTQMGFCRELVEWALEAKELLEMVEQRNRIYEMASELVLECPVKWVEDPDA